MTSIEQIPAILDELEAIYDSTVANLRSALNAYARDGVRPDRKAARRRRVCVSGNPHCL